MAGRQTPAQASPVQCGLVRRQSRRLLAPVADHGHIDGVQARPGLEGRQCQAVQCRRLLAAEGVAHAQVGVLVAMRILVLVAVMIVIVVVLMIVGMTVSVVVVMGVAFLAVCMILAAVLVLIVAVIMVVIVLMIVVVQQRWRGDLGGLLGAAGGGRQGQDGTSILQLLQQAFGAGALLGIGRPRLEVDQAVQRRAEADDDAAILLAQLMEKQSGASVPIQEGFLF